MKRRSFLGAGAAALTGAAGMGVSRAQPEDPIEGLTNQLEGVDPIAPSEYVRRQEQARRLMAGQGVEALFVEGGSSLYYFTGVRWGRSERTFGVVIPRRGRPGFVCPAFEEGRARESIDDAGAEVRTWQEHESPFQVVAGILKDRAAASGKVGVEPSTRFFIVDGFRRAAPAVDWVSGKAVSDGCRMAKSDTELALMRRANEITKRAYKAAAGGLREGMTPAQLNERISEAHRRMGTRGGALVLFGPAAAFPHGTRETRRLKEGDVVLLDGGCKVHGYSSDVTRTLVFGEPSQRQRQIWGVVRRAQEKALRAARPGLACQELDRIARREIEEAGFGSGYRVFTHRLGHGIGLDGHEEPYLVEGNTLAMRPGMTFSNEPGIYLPGELGVRHEDIMVITEEGAEFLGPASESIERPL